MKRKFWIIAVLLWVFIGVLVWFGIKPVRTWYYERFRGGDLMAASIERRRALDDLWRLIEEYRNSNGVWPQSPNDLISSSLGREKVFFVPEWSGGRSYEFDFSVLGESQRKLVAFDPGVIWPGGEFEANRYRIGLTNRGEVASYYEIELWRMLPENVESVEGRNDSLRGRE